MRPKRLITIDFVISSITKGEQFPRSLPHLPHSPSLDCSGCVDCRVYQSLTEPQSPRPAPAAPCLDGTATTMMTASCRGGNRTATQGDEARTMTGIHSRTMTARLLLLRHAVSSRTETALVRTATTIRRLTLLLASTTAIIRARAIERPHVMVIETASCSHLAMIESLILLLVATLLPALSTATSTSESECPTFSWAVFDTTADSRPRAYRTAPSSRHDDVKDETAAKEEGEVTPLSLDPVEEPDPEAILAERRRKRAEILAKYANNPPPPPSSRSETATPSSSDLLPGVDAFKKREGEEEGATPGREQVERVAKRLRIQGTGALLISRHFRASVAGGQRRN